MICSKCAGEFVPNIGRYTCDDCMASRRCRIWGGLDGWIYPAKFVATTLKAIDRLRLGVEAIHAPSCTCNRCFDVLIQTAVELAKESRGWQATQQEANK